MTCRTLATISLACAALMVQSALADVKTEEKTKVEFPGLLGGIVKTFGGKAARDGVVEKVALKGNRKMSVNEDTAQLIDLNEEKVYQIDLKKKTYTVVTFEEMRRQMQEAMAKAKEAAAKRDEKAKTADQKPPEYTVDYTVKESGQKKTINGYAAREVVATITVHEKDKKAEDGAMVLTSSMWLAPRIAAMKEMEDFNRRFAEKLYLPVAQEMAEQMAPAMGMYPGLKEAMGKLEGERVNMDGTAVLTETRAEAIASPTQQAAAPPAQENKQEGIPKSLGGLLGGLGKKIAKKDDNADAGKPAALMTTNHELLSVSTSVTDADVSIPAGFKEKQ